MNKLILEKRITNMTAGDAVILFLMALFVRMLCYPYFCSLLPGGDEKDYWEFALTVASGQIPDRYYHPPLWGYLLSPFAFFSKNPVTGRLFVAVIGSFSVSMVYLLSERLFDRKTAWLAGIIYLLYPNLIGFSHYLWAETMLAFLVLLATFVFFSDPVALKGIEHLPLRKIYLAFFIAGIAILVKEFAAILAVSFTTLLLVSRIKNKSGIIAVSLMIFLLPVVIYSVWASFSAGRPVLLADAFIYNSNQVEHDFETFTWSHEKNTDLFLNALIHEKLMKIPESFPKQVSALWGPNSYPYFRLNSAPEMFGKYHIRHVREISLIIVFSYVFIVIMGITGIFFSEYTTFSLFGALNLFFLSSLALIFLMCSRFRIPYMFVFIIYSAVILKDPQRFFFNMKHPKRIMAWSGLVALFIFITVIKWTDLGSWG